MKQILARFCIGFIGLALIGFGIGYTPEYPRAQALKKYTNAESEFITLAPGTRVHLRDQGDSASPALILIHGSNASLHTWEAWVTQLKNNYRIITLDLPGHGLTGVGGSADYSVESQVEIVNQILISKNIKSAIIGGNSMGGAVSLAFALKHPNKTWGLVLIDSSGAPTAAKSGPKPKGNIGFTLARNPVAGFLMTKITPRSLIEKSLIQSVATPRTVTPEMVDRYWELLRYDDNRGATLKRFASYAARSSAPVPDLRNVTVPTLIMWGREDNLISVANAAVFQKRIANSQVIIYDGVGHIPMEEIPTISAIDLRLWLAKIKMN